MITDDESLINNSFTYAENEHQVARKKKALLKVQIQSSWAICDTCDAAPTMQDVTGAKNADAEQKQKFMQFPRSKRINVV